MTSPPASEPKLRTSCDRCQAAKVRCSRSKPSCWRCSQSGVKCVYSPLRRTGRPRKSHSDTVRKGLNKEGDPSCQAVTATSQPNGETHRDEQEPEGITLEKQPAITLPETGKDINSELNQSYIDLLLDDTWDFDAQDVTMSISDNLESDSILEGASWTQGLLDANPPIWDSSLANWATDSSITTPDVASLSSASTELPGDAPVSCGNSIHSGASFCSTKHQSDEMPRILGHQSDQPSPTPTSHNRPQWETIETPKVHESRILAPRSENPGTNPGESNISRCYQVISGMLAQLSDHSLIGENASLDKLLGLDRELQIAISMVLSCQTCITNQNGSTVTMLVIMTLDKLLSLFEMQGGETSRQNSTQEMSQLLKSDKILAVGDFAIDGEVKIIVLRQLVFGFLDHLGSMLLQVERRVDVVSKGVNRKVARDMTDDIGRRISFLRGWLQLSTQTYQ